MSEPAKTLNSTSCSPERSGTKAAKPSSPYQPWAEVTCMAASSGNGMPMSSELESSTICDSSASTVSTAVSSSTGISFTSPSVIPAASGPSVPSVPSVLVVSGSSASPGSSLSLKTVSTSAVMTTPTTSTPTTPQMAIHLPRPPPRLGDGCPTSP